MSLLEGFHYQTDQLGKIISWIKGSKLRDRVIVVATGDHPQRTFMDNQARVKRYLRYSVPAYFYVPDELDVLSKVPPNIAGSHYDLSPTLFELSLSNAEYYNFGQAFMDKTMDEAYGWASSGRFIFSDGLVDSKNNKFYAWQDEQQQLLEPTATPVSEEKAKVLEKEKYRKLLKKYLIVEDYQK